MRSRPVILLCCGEMSGDMHAALLVRRLREELPGARILAMGGDRCREAGAELLFHFHDYHVLGFSGVLANLPRFLRLEKALKSRLSGGVDLFIPVDYPGLNIRLARHARRQGIPVLYYISPQVWAWGEGRIDKLKRYVDRMAVILPFEEPLYRRHGVPVEYVGHPFVVDHALPDPLPAQSREGIGLLPGSRIQEVKRILPALVSAAVHMERSCPGLGFVVGKSDAVGDRLYDDIIRRHAGGLNIRTESDAVDVMRRSRLLLVASGTATLQGALLDTPLVIVYRVSALNYLLARRLVKIPNIGLVNVILGDPVCPEFVQGGATGANIATGALELLHDGPARETMRNRFSQLRRMLAGGGGCRRVARIAAQLLEAS